MRLLEASAHSPIADTVGWILLHSVWQGAGHRRCACLAAVGHPVAACALPRRVFGVCAFYLCRLNLPT
jgi:hypothetical protein